MKKEALEEIKKYKDYPEGSGGKAIYDSIYLPFSQYLEKYYVATDLSTWNVWQNKYIEPSFDTSRHQEMIKNFGYVSIDAFNFDVQSKIYQELKGDRRFDDETRKFISFLAGTRFFEKYKLTLITWFDMKNWSHPEHNSQEERKTINELLTYPLGINMLKSRLPQMPYWKR